MKEYYLTIPDQHRYSDLFQQMDLCTGISPIVTNRLPSLLFCISYLTGSISFEVVQYKTPWLFSFLPLKDRISTANKKSHGSTVSVIVAPPEKRQEALERFVGVLATTTLYLEPLSLQKL
jgi:hypothetical protein